MNHPVMHYAHEVLYDTVWAPACENAAGLDCFTEGDPDAELTDDEGAVTCTDCLIAMGYEVCPQSLRPRIAA